MSKASTVFQCLAVAALVLVVAAALPTTANAVEFRIVGSLIDTADLSEAPGGGIGLTFPFGTGNWGFDVAIYYFENFENQFESGNPTACVNFPGCPEKVELRSYPFDFGARYRQNPDDSGFIGGLGLSFFPVDPDRADADDTEGAYGMIGYQTRGGWVFEFLYRDADITIEDIELQGGGRLPGNPSFQLDMSGYQINVGYSF